MELNVPLPQNLRELLKGQVSEEPVYCVNPDVDLDGRFTEGVYVGATKAHLFAIYNRQLNIIKLADCENVQVRKQVDSGILTATINGVERPIARFTLKHSTQMACLARGVKLFLKGQTEKRVENHDREKTCPTCGRMLNRAGKCFKCNKKSQSLNRILEICRPYWLTFLIVFLIMAMTTALNLGQQFVLRWFVDGFLSVGKGNIGDIAVFIALYFGFVLMGFAGSLIKSFLSSRLGMRISYNLRKQLTSHVQGLSMSFLHKRNTGELLERIFSDTYNIRVFFSNSFCNMFHQVVTLIALTVLMLVLNWKLALAAFAFAPLIIIFARTFWPHIRKIFHRQRRKNDRMHNKLQDVLSGIRIVKSYGREKAEIEQFDALNDDFARVQKKNELFFATVFPVLSLLLSFGTYLIVYLGGLDVLAGNMTPGALMQFVSYAGMLLGPLSWMSFLPRQIVNATTSLDRIYDILDEKSEITVAQNPVKREINGEIEFKDVVFGYLSHEIVLDGINLKVAPGEMIGLVGASGTGKSTIINLVMRLYDVDEGEITVDGVDIKNYEPEDYHRQIGVVLQETFLFAGTVLDNLRFAKPEASLEEVIKAAKAASAHEFICKLPDGYNTYVGEKGHTLSGGEKQRIAIARAILGDPKILILDEATSALDTESEYQIQKALERLRQGRTTFAIAHRLSTLKSADRIAVIDDHKIAELGTHNELLRKKGIYYGLVMAQLEMNGRKQEQ